MIKILIIEDEPPIAAAVKQMIEQLSSIFEVVGCENNGQAALLRLEEETVDVVITDIRMPVMNGLEFLERLIVLYPHCLSVILSGHQDFTYAQTALRLGAFDYLLKPLSPTKLKDLLDRLEEAFSKRVIPSDQNVIETAAYPGPHATNKPNCWVLLACAGNWPLIPDDTLVPGAAFWKEHDPEKLVRLFIKKKEEVLVLEGKTSTEYVFVIKNATALRVTQIAQTLFATFTRLSTLPITLYMASDPVPLWETGTLIPALRSKLYVNIKLCRSTLFTSTTPRETINLSELPINEVIEALCVSDNELLNYALDKTIDKAVRTGMSQQEFVRFLDIVISDQRLITRTTADLKLELDEAISNAVTPELLKADLFQILNQFNLDEGKTDKKIIISQIKQYLNDNYNKSISNEMLSALFGFVPSYISKIFRNQTGVSPSEYLTNLRIEKAKNLLDTRKDLLIREVSLLVGYNDPYYFSKAFRKITGLWPTQYQEEHSAKSNHF